MQTGCTLRLSQGTSEVCTEAPASLREVTLRCVAQAYIDKQEPATGSALEGVTGWVKELSALKHDSKSSVTQEVRKCGGMSLKWSKQCVQLARDVLHPAMSCNLSRERHAEAALSS